MKSERTFNFKKEYTAFPLKVQQALEKQLRFLMRDLRHPSLRAKKYDESGDIWQARVTGDIRFYFRIVGDTYRLLSIRKHPK